MTEIFFDILEIIPQRHPIVMIDKIVRIDEREVVCQFIVRKNNFFVLEDRFTEAGIIENIAQTVAAGAGYRSKINNKNIRLGYIASIKNLNIHSLPSVGDELITCVQIVNSVFNVVIVHTLVKAGTTNIADCEMRIFLEDNE